MSAKEEPRQEARTNRRSSRHMTTTIATRRQSPLAETWRQFNRALRDPRQDFNPFVWIGQLLLALGDHVYVTSGCESCILAYNLHKAWRPFVPYGGLGLVMLVLVAYYQSIRFVLAKRWCCDETSEGGTEECIASSCLWMHVHNVLVAYLGGMILFHYTCAVFVSPGVALPTNVTTVNPPQWQAMESQGGVYGMNATCRVDQERARVALYGTLEAPTQQQQQQQPTGGVPNSGITTTAISYCQPTTTSDTPIYFPSPHASFCAKCQIWRPPRCHHCSVCQRCVLQFDHHCMWVNQCIGYNNYRHFVLMLAYFMVGCWYGVALLFPVFYEPFWQQIQQHGFQWMYSNGTGMLDLPMPHIILLHLLRRDMPSQMVINLVYPLLLGIGAVLSGFLGFHVKYMLLARTTLEHSVRLEEQIHQARSSSSANRSTSATPLVHQAINPFDQGYKKNLWRILGPSTAALFLPIPVRPFPPYQPQPGKSK